MSSDPTPLFPVPAGPASPRGWVGQPPATTAAPTTATSGITRYASVRVGDAERGVVCDQLARHFAEGRLSPDELDVRLAAATGAVTQADLSGLLSDLPREGYRAQPAAYPRATVSPVSAPHSGADVLTWIGVIAAFGLIMMLMLGIGMVSPLMFVASAFGGMVALALGGGIVHLMHRAVDRRRPPTA